MKDSTYEPLGLWDASLRKSDYSEFIEAAEKQANRSKGLKKGRKTWGLGLVIGSIITYLLLQTAFGLVSLRLLLPAWLKADPNLTSTQVQAKYTTWAEQPLVIVFSQGSLYLLWILFMLAATYLRGKKSFLNEFRLRFKLRDLPWGVGIGIAAFVISSLILKLLQHVILPNANYAGSDNSTLLTSQKGLALIFITFGIGSVAAPFFEELFFRGFVMQGLYRLFRGSAHILLPAESKSLYFVLKRFFYRMRYPFSIVLSSALFGAFHTQSVATFGGILVPIVTGSVGIILAIIAIRTKRLGRNMITHSTFNTVSLLFSVLGITWFS